MSSNRDEGGAEVAVVGAGVAGAGVAYALGEAVRGGEATVTAFERRDRVGGRAATRRRRGCVYDYGANYLKADDDRVTDLVAETLETTGLVDVEEPVQPFAADGSLLDGGSEEGDEHKWSYRDGIDALPRRLFGRSGAAVETGTPVEALSNTGWGWRLATPDGPRGEFDAVVLTPPAPVTGDLLATADGVEGLAGLVDDLADVPYRTTVSAVLHYPEGVDRPYYALVSADKDHDVWWLSREECKPGHVPDGESLLVVQCSPAWSERNCEVADAARRAARPVANLLGESRLADPDWTDAACWRHAQPDGGVDGDRLRDRAPEGLHFAGDWLAGEGRLHLALRSGLEAGDRLADRLGA